MLALIRASFLPLLVIAGKKYGSDDCKCVGIDVSGAIRPFPAVAVDDTANSVSATYPPELGTTCTAWDDGVHSSCSGAHPPAFCKQKWCYVDPCKCKKAISASTYLPSWKYHKRPLHFSYETCGSTSESWFKESKVAQHVTAKCSEPESGVGSPDCPCVGLGGKPGHISLMYAGKEGPYKQEIGSTCSLWENGAYPDCTIPGADGKIPDWCFQTWCYVDGCNCKGLAEAPRPTQKLAGSNFHGAPMYFSFNTCGGNYLLGDGWVEKSCWTKKTSQNCEAHSNLLGQQCGWYDGRCIDANIIPSCQAAAQAKDEL